MLVKALLLLLLAFGVLAQEPASAPSPEAAAPTSITTSVYNINNYGAKGDGITDDSPALSMAWSGACASSLEATVLIPKDQVFLMNQVVLPGPCKSRIKLQVDGVVQAPQSTRAFWDPDLPAWITIMEVNGLEVSGDGSFDGNGGSWWFKSCNDVDDPLCVRAPYAIEFHEITNLVIKGLHVYNSPRMHINFNGCRNVAAKWLKVLSPADSPNTDGIHVSKSKDVLIEYSFIGVGDDCISIVAGSSNVEVNDIVCGAGHGISIGSLGGRPEIFDEVSNINVHRAALLGTTNGLRIKTYKNGQGAVTNVTFSDIRLDTVYNPIIIDQYYCDSHKHSCATDASVQEITGVKIKNVIYDNITGTFNEKVKTAILLKCSDVANCEGIHFGKIQISRSASRSPLEPFSKCANAYGRVVDDSGPKNCLKSSKLKT